MSGPVLRDSPSSLLEGVAPVEVAQAESRERASSALMATTADAKGGGWELEEIVGMYRC
jgi:hypothetical protein